MGLGSVIIKGIIIGPFNYNEENGNLKIFIERLREKREGEGRGGPQSLWSLAKDTKTFSFRSNEPFY